jgi:transmembrane sensor
MSKAPVSEINSLSDQAIDWVIRLHSRRATEQDYALAEEWRGRSPSHRKAFADAEQLWLEMGEALQAADSLQAALEPPAAAERTGYKNGRLPALAAAVLLFALGIRLSGSSDRWLSDYYTAVGEQKNVTLSDGSRVLLNTDTALSVDFDKFGRRITLQRGQAVFYVAKDPGRPFEVATDEAVVKALGTVFEVLQERRGTRVTVEEHAVSIKGLHDEDYAESARINAGQQARYSKEQGLEAPEAADPKQISAWQRGKLIFKNQPLAAVVGELDRYYPGRMMIVDGSLKSLRVTGVFPVHDPAAALNTIADILPVKMIRLTPWLTLLKERGILASPAL